MTDNQFSIASKQVVLRRGKTNQGTDEGHGGNGKSNERLDLLMETIRNASCDKFTGYIKVNYTQGTIGRVEKFEEILRK